LNDKPIIIGARFAGLAAGVYAQMNGYRTRIYEMHSQPGDRTAYDEKKDQVARTVVTLLDQRFAGISEQLEMVDVATPLDLGALHGQLARQLRGLADHSAERIGHDAAHAPEPARSAELLHVRPVGGAWRRPAVRRHERPASHPGSV
jgi:hypothetical protein